MTVDDVNRDRWFREALRALRESGEDAFYELHYYERVDSTNEVVKREACGGAGEGFTAVGEEQTAGKGRRGRVWKSPAGEAVYFSFLLRPRIPAERVSMLTLVMGLAVAQAVRELYDLEAAIKWPNDIVIDGRKICGILTEALPGGGSGSPLAGIVIGVGINVNNEGFPEELTDRAASLKLILGREASRADVLARVLQTFHCHYMTFMRTEDLSGLKTAYDELLISRDRQVRIEDPRGAYIGISRGIDEEGQLVVELPEGGYVSVSSGEVSVRGLYGYI